MQATVVPRASYRPPVRRMSKQELQGNSSSNDLNVSSTASMNRWPNRNVSQVAPEMNYPWRPMEQPPRNLNNDERNQCPIHRGWFWLFGGVFCLILIVAIVGVVLGVVFTIATTPAPNPDATAKMMLLNPEIVTPLTCSSIDRGTIARLNETVPSGWISYSYNYSASKTIPILLFGFETSGAHVYYLDALSVVDVSAPSIELLTDPSFESSTTNSTTWTQSCESACANQIVSGSQCSGSSNNCFMAFCPNGNSSISFLSQSFPATIGNIYTISYMLNYLGNATNGSAFFYLDVI